MNFLSQLKYNCNLEGSFLFRELPMKGVTYEESFYASPEGNNQAHLKSSILTALVCFSNPCKILTSQKAQAAL